jgi:hypothetical protein
VPGTVCEPEGKRLSRTASGRRGSNERTHAFNRNSRTEPGVTRNRIRASGPRFLGLQRTHGHPLARIGTVEPVRFIVGTHDEHVVLHGNGPAKGTCGSRQALLLHPCAGRILCEYIDGTFNGSPYDQGFSVGRYRLAEPVFGAVGR